MVISFDIVAEEGDVYRVLLSSGEDAFFGSSEIDVLVGQEVEIIEIDLERLSGCNPASLKTLWEISNSIFRCIKQNDKAVLFYFCDDMNEIPVIGKGKEDMWPQEYRSLLFHKMFQRYVMQNHVSEDYVDISVVINEDSRPLYMHFISRSEHVHYVNMLKEYISSNYSK